MKLGPAVIITLPY